MERTVSENTSPSAQVMCVQMWRLQWKGTSCFFSISQDYSSVSASESLSSHPEVCFLLKKHLSSARNPNCSGQLQDTGSWINLVTEYVLLDNLKRVENFQPSVSAACLIHMNIFSFFVWTWSKWVFIKLTTIKKLKYLLWKSGDSKPQFGPRSLPRLASRQWWRCSRRMCPATFVPITWWLGFPNNLGAWAWIAHIAPMPFK